MTHQVSPDLLREPQSVISCLQSASKKARNEVLIHARTVMVAAAVEVKQVKQVQEERTGVRNKIQRRQEENGR